MRPLTDSEIRRCILALQSQCQQVNAARDRPELAWNYDKDIAAYKRGIAMLRGMSEDPDKITSMFSSDEAPTR
jgi:hypothetical protein